MVSMTFDISLSGVVLHQAGSDEDTLTELEYDNFNQISCPGSAVAQ